MNILVVSSNYPNTKAPHYGAFVYNLVQEFAKRHNVTVIAPVKVHDFFKKHRVPNYGNEKCHVIRPKYLSFSNKIFFGFDTIRLSRLFIKKSILKTINKLPDKIDIIYCHFLNNGVHVLDYADDHSIPLVIASGESTYDDWKTQPISIQEKAKKIIKHIICVSESNKKKLLDLGFSERKITVIPNAVNYDIFKPMNKIDCKNKLGLSNTDFIVGFVGHFIERKGPNRIIQAIKKINDKNIKLICVGSGEKLESNDFTIVIPPVPNNKLPEIYNAFDIFVLPTLSEGHCNVIEEAKACGIPIVSSKGGSVEHQLIKENGWLINPLDIDEIASAIMLGKLNTISFKGVEETNESNIRYDIKKRADKILKLLASII